VDDEDLFDGHSTSRRCETATPTTFKSSSSRPLKGIAASVGSGLRALRKLSQNRLSAGRVARRFWPASGIDPHRAADAGRRTARQDVPTA
jgi:hypothetical protein